MAKRCLTSVTIDGVEYPLAQLSSFSFINSSESNRAVYRSNSEMLYVSEKQTDFIPLITPFVESGKGYKGLTDFNASIVNYPYTTVEGQRIAIQFVQDKGTDGTVLSSIGFGYSGNDLEMYVSIVIDDSTQTGYIIIAYYINEPSTAYGTGYGMYINGGSNTQGQLIYNIFKAYNIPFGGGAGSGYIGNTLVSNKKMVGYNVPTSSAESTKTESVNDASESPVSGKPKIGNGHVLIKLLQQVTELDVLEVTASSNMVDSKGVIPTVVEGGGTYTEENGYYCNSSTILEYSKNLSPSILKASGYIDFELTGINNNGWGDSRDTGIQIRNDSDNTVIMTAVFANGNADTSTDTKEIIRVRSSADNVIYKFTNYDGSALDVNKNAWHDVKIRVYITNNKWVKGECYVDDTLWLSYDVPDDVTIEGWNGALRTRVEIIGANGIKHCKVTRKFEG